MDNAIQDGIAEGGFADHLVPGRHRELAGNQHGATAMAILDDLHEVATLTGRETIGSPIVEHEEVDLDQGAEQPRESAIAVCKIETANRRGTRA